MLLPTILTQVSVIRANRTSTIGVSLSPSYSGPTHLIEYLAYSWKSLILSYFVIPVQGLDPATHYLLSSRQSNACRSADVWGIDKGMISTLQPACSTSRIS